MHVELGVKGLFSCLKSGYTPPTGSQPFDGDNDMPKVDDETLRQRFLKAKEAWDERQKTNRAKRRREKAQADAQRDALIVRMVRHQVQADPSKQERLIAQMDAFLEDDKERALFDLPPKTSVPASAAPDSHTSPGDPSRL